ncbi:MAG TPA: sensor domain-containing diguanylate cyclase, partial [Gammaproteobacteria bacterium]|nr:sensor domain-containing diguanylate cyclase [Gammaproteobacteria bacterium]
MRQPYSIRSRYFIAAFLAAIILLSVILVAQYNASRTSEANLIRIRLREDVSQHTSMIRLGVLTAMDTLTDHLLNPQDETKSLWQRKITAILDHLYMVDKSGWGNHTNTSELTHKLERSIKLLDVKALKLIQSRRNAESTNPALFYARQTMLPVQHSVITFLNQVMDELTEEQNKDTLRIYTKVSKVQQYWIQIIAAFRLYIVNRLGSFDDSTLAQQAQDIELIYTSLVPLVKELITLGEQGKLGLTGSTVREDLYASMQAWYRDFLTVRTIYTSKHWRNDIIIKNEQLLPLVSTIFELLQKMERNIETSARKDLQFLEHMADDNIKMLWYIFSIVLALFVLGYLYFDRSILSPIRQVSEALLDEARGSARARITHGKTRESQALIDAFSQMRQKVSSRQMALEHQALHDALTDLPNRVLLNDRLKQCILSSTREKHSLALLIMDLDHFKEINDTLGHQVGDEILIAIGKRLKKLLRVSDTVARLGGDEFAII